jgi:hypothetical protein
LKKYVINADNWLTSIIGQSGLFELRRQIKLLRTNEWRLGRFLEACYRNLLLCWLVWVVPWLLNLLLFLQIGQADELVRQFYLTQTPTDFLILSVLYVLCTVLAAWRLDARLWFLSSSVGLLAIPISLILGSKMGASPATLLPTEYLIDLATMALVVDIGWYFLFSHLTRDREHTFSIITLISVFWLLLEAMAPIGFFIQLPPWSLAMFSLLAWMNILVAIQATFRRQSVKFTRHFPFYELTQRRRLIRLRSASGLLGVATLFMPILGWLLTGIATFSVIRGRWWRKVAIATLVIFFLGDSYKSHELTLASPADKTYDAARLTADEHFLQWIRPRLKTATSANPYPIIIVSADGGGIRAAYWTYNVLAGLHDEFPDFYSHLYAIGSISGASLGAASFVSTVAAAHLSHQGVCNLDPLVMNTPCLTKLPAGPLSRNNLREKVRGGWLSQWVGDKFGLTNIYSQDRFEAAVLASSAREVRPWLLRDIKTFPMAQDPLLVLGSTDALSGKPLIASQAQLPKELRDINALDMVSAGESISLLDAAYHSARFPAISNPGKIIEKDGKVLMAVDGGYYDNSAAEIMQGYEHMIRRLESSEPEITGKIKIILLVLTNRPENESKALWSHPYDQGFMAAAQSLSAFEQVRQIRAVLAKRHLVQAISADRGECINFGVGASEYPIPVGWALGTQAYLQLDSFLNSALNLNIDGAARRLAKAASFKTPFEPSLAARYSSACDY